MTTVKSIIPVNTTKGWAARQRFTDGMELFIIGEKVSYTMHQAQMVCDSLRRHIARGGETYAEPMPTGVKVIRG